MTSKRKSRKNKSESRIEVLIGCTLGSRELHVVLYIDGMRHELSSDEAVALRKSLKASVKHIRERS